MLEEGTEGRSLVLVRVRVRGLRRAADDLVFIDRERIKESSGARPRACRTIL